MLEPGGVRPRARRREPACRRGAHRDRVGRRRDHHAPRGLDQPQGRLLPRGAAQSVLRRAAGHAVAGIAGRPLFLLLAALALSRALLGEPLLAIGTLYDPFVTRGLDALYHALYSGSRFVVAATPSGVTLSPEGGAHQSVITPGIGVALPGIVFWGPAFAR